MNPYREPAAFDVYTTHSQPKHEIRLKSRFPLWPFLWLIAMTGLTSGACSLFTAKNIKTVLDVAKIACLIANAESTDDTIRTVCQIVDTEADAARQVLSAQRDSVRRYASSRATCGDGGTFSEGVMLSGDAGHGTRDAGQDSGR